MSKLRSVAKLSNGIAFRTTFATRMRVFKLKLSKERGELTKKTEGENDPQLLVIDFY